MVGSEVKHKIKESHHKSEAQWTRDPLAGKGRGKDKSQNVLRDCIHWATKSQCETRRFVQIQARSRKKMYRRRLPKGDREGKGAESKADQRVLI